MTGVNRSPGVPTIRASSDPYAGNYPISQNGFRIPWNNTGRLIVANGDSRTQQYYTNFQNKRKNSQSPIAWANAKRKQRRKIVLNLAASGQRTDQYCSAANIQASLAVNADVALIGSPAVNNIAQALAGYVHATTGATITLANVVDTVISDLSAWHMANLTAGRICEQWLEPGATSFTVAQIAAMHELNSKLFIWCRNNGVECYNPCPVVWNNNPATATETTLSFKPGYSTDGTHLSSIGAAAIGDDYALFGDRMCSSVEGPYGQNINSTRLDPAGAVINSNPNALMPNPMYHDTSAGGAATGGIAAIGTAPKNFLVNGPATQSVTISNSVDANGYGNDYTFVLSDTGSGLFRMFMVTAPATSNYELTDIITGGMEIIVAAGSSNAAPFCAIELNSDAGTVSREDMEPTIGGAFPATAYTLMLQTEPATFAPGSTTKGYVQLYVKVKFFAPGNITFTVRRPFLDKVSSL